MINRTPLNPSMTRIQEEISYETLPYFFLAELEFFNFPNFCTFDLKIKSNRDTQMCYTKKESLKPSKFDILRNSSFWVMEVGLNWLFLSRIFYASPSKWAHKYYLTHTYQCSSRYVFCHPGLTGFRVLT